jgi:RNA polymerase sigma-70 factor (ECF subfamily)
VNPSLEIAAVLQLARAGDSEAFDNLFRHFRPGLLRQAVLLCGDQALAEDIAQETLIEAWKSLARYNERCQFFTWLCAILHNRYRNHWRRKRLLCFLGFETTATAEAQEHLLRVSPEPWPDQTVQSLEQAASIRRCVQALPSKQQQVVYLRFFVDQSLEGIAAALHCSVGTVKSRLFHALERLRRMPGLQHEYEPPKRINVE